MKDKPLWYDLVFFAALLFLAWWLNSIFWGS